MGAMAVITVVTMAAIVAEDTVAVPAVVTAAVRAVAARVAEFPAAGSELFTSHHRLP